MRTTPLLALLALTAACGGGNDAATGDTAGTATVDTPPAASAGAGAGAAGQTAAGATAEMRDSTGRAIGTLTLAAAGGGIQTSGHLTGLAPGQHGVHVHAVGQCTPPFESAGPHWNPASKKHGSENPQGAHHGDMPNITVGADGSAHVSVTTAAGAMLDSLMDADGAAIVVHEKADDYKTDPSGNSGKRVACGVISRR